MQLLTPMAGLAGERRAPCRAGCAQGLDQAQAEARPAPRPDDPGPGRAGGRGGAGRARRRGRTAAAAGGAQRGRAARTRARVAGRLGGGRRRVPAGGRGGQHAGGPLATAARPARPGVAGGRAARPAARERTGTGRASVPPPSASWPVCCLQRSGAVARARRARWSGRACAHGGVHANTRGHSRSVLRCRPASLRRPMEPGAQAPRAKRAAAVAGS